MQYSIFYVLHLAIYLLILLTQGQAEVEKEVEKINISVTILNERHKLHEEKALELLNQIESQVKDFPELVLKVQVASTAFPHQPYWTLYPLLEEYERTKSDWLLFVDEYSSVDVKNLLAVIKEKKDSSFIGRSLHDIESSVIHHYAAPGALPRYPDLRSGFVLSGDAVRRAAAKYDPVAVASGNQFAIDVGYEFALWLLENFEISLDHSDAFCVRGALEDVKLDGCAVVALAPRVCDPTLPAVQRSDLHVSVKTYSGNHDTRLPVLRSTWLPGALNFRIYSDVEDAAHGTVQSGVPNTERGHCAKTLTILRQSLERPQPWRWLLVADDDTLISLPRLLSALSCYSADEAVALGEMYGYRAAPHLLVPYPTGGSGMVFSRPMVELLIESSWCKCRSADEPDDMLLGMCLHRLGRSLVHVRDMHQASPKSYAAGRLYGSKPISFHGFWMIDPVQEYKKWLKEKRNSGSGKAQSKKNSRSKDEL
ncbi:Fringe-like [Trinorchestia longiramus]|nr:Fringe-like [Trinorchestia longiramus]